MSDNVEELEKCYDGNVFPARHPRSIGLFTIPEYPEYESKRGMWSAAIDAILTTLRYLAPATLLTLFWGQQSFFFKILKHIDTVFRAIVFSSEEQKQAVLQWMADVGPVRVEHLDTIWSHGWILCGVLDAALPGACAGHPPTRLSLKHAQAIADHYLGVEPVFSRQELESNDSLSRHQEWKLATYLDRIRQALAKLTPPVSKPNIQHTSSGNTQFTLDYVAKGSGLTAAQVKSKMNFKIYPTAQQSLDPGEITILIRGPKDTYGMAVFPPILGKAQTIRQKLLGLQTQQNYTGNALPITHGAAYFRSYGKNDMNKTYYIPKTKYDIEIEVDTRPDHAKVSYLVNLEGRYEISITTRGQSIVGSPFTVTASHNIIDILEKENFCLEDGEEIDIVDVKTDRKVVLRIVDFVTEKMLLKENGSLEKISDEEAKMLMATDSENETTINKNDSSNNNITSERMDENTTKTFNKVAKKILKINRICKIMNDEVREKRLKILQDDNNSSHQQDIPDIVNSTFTEINTNPFILTEKRSKFIVPENISVSLRTEKSKPFYEEELIDIHENDKPTKNITSRINYTINSPDSIEKNQTESEPRDDNSSLDRTTPLSNTNPFVSNINDGDFIQEENLSTFVSSEHKTNNSQSEDIRDASVKIIINPSCTPTIPPRKHNPFLKNDIRTAERPKSPIFQFMTGEVGYQDHLNTEDSKSELIPEEMLGNEFVNPFFIHHHQYDPHEQLPITDFIIGAPVSLPPIIRATSPKQGMNSLIMTSQNDQVNTLNKKTFFENNNNNPSDFSGTNLIPEPLNNSKYENTAKTNNNSLSLTTFHSMESNLTDTVDKITSTAHDENPYEVYKNEHIPQDNNSTIRKETWDSAYVSIDDNNSTSDNNNNDSPIGQEATSKQKFTACEGLLELKKQELHLMGPAEREIWQTCSELNETKLEESKPNKWEVKRPVFTPIIEECDKTISSRTKDILRSDKLETDVVSVAFAELNEIYTEYFPLSENSSTTVLYENKQRRHSTNFDYAVQMKKNGVDSASEMLSDVKRHNHPPEGMISEVQSNVAESLSVSQTLLDEYNRQAHTCTVDTTSETQFVDSNKNNIVMEKKKYWDEKIRQLEAKSEEATILPKKKRTTSSKQMKHDSLSKRKGKQMIKNFLNAGGYNQTKHIQPMNTSQCEEDKTNSTLEELSKEQKIADEKIVEKWKKYWDDKLIKQHGSSEAVPIKTRSQVNQSTSVKVDDVITDKRKLNAEVPSEILTTPITIKHELPEEVFKAFETSPKRFFGTSRKQILSKIDIFSARSSSSEESSPEIVEMNHDSGLVSSRISLFHTLSNTEELPWINRKSKSMHNIYHSKDNNNENSFEKRLQIETKANKTCISKGNDLKRPVVSNNENPIEVNIPKDCTLKRQTLSIPSNDKRTRIFDDAFNKTVDDESIYVTTCFEPDSQSKPVTRVTTVTNLKNSSADAPNDILRKKSFSKSEMDIFSKVPSTSDDDYLDKYKSCDELPRINVKSFISLYEGVNKTAVESIPKKRIYRTSSVDSEKLLSTISNNSDTDRKHEAINYRTVETTRTPISDKHTSNISPRKLTLHRNSSIHVDSQIKDTNDRKNTNVQVTRNQDKETTYISLSDIELEIIESSPDKSSESSPERDTVAAHVEYRNRFKSAKEYFQSLEELREVKKPRKLNECELLLKKSNESLENTPTERRKKKIKSHSMPSSEISKIWSQLQDNKNEEESDASSTKLIKISEKFNVDDIFSDVMEGRLSRQGSLRGIPNMKAVLETFRSMENIADHRITPCKITESQFSEFATDTSTKNAQSYLKEYPYLPTTDPSKFHSRVDVKASGLITFKELLGKRPRRNSVPDLRLNAKFTEDL